MVRLIYKERRGGYDKKNPHRTRDWGYYYCDEHGVFQRWCFVFNDSIKKGRNGCPFCGKEKNHRELPDMCRRAQKVCVETKARRLKRPDTPDWVIDSLVDDRDKEVFRARDYESHKKYKFLCKNCGRVSLRYPYDVWSVSTGDPRERCMGCYFLSDEYYESRKKAYETQLNSGTFMRSRLEVQIDREFGSIHAPCGYNDWRFEIDCYWPDLKLGVEVDDPSHYECEFPGELQKFQGYHKMKDSYFSSLGISILHITFNRIEGVLGWRDIVRSFLEGRYTGDLINVNDPTYGDIIY